MSDKNLELILYEGTKKVYGTEKAEELKKEFKSHPYRSEDLTSVVQRVINQPEIIDAEFTETESVEDIVELQQEPSTYRVAVRGTKNLLHKTSYPLYVGALSGNRQEAIVTEFNRGKRSEDKIAWTYHYTAIESLAEMAGAAALGFAAYHYNNTTLGIVAGAVGVYNFLRFVLRKNIGPSASPFVTIPTYFSHFITNSIPFAARAIAKPVVASFSDAYEQEKEKLLQGPKMIEQPKRIEKQPGITLTPDGEKFEYVESDKEFNRKNSGI